jgi:ribosomal protein S18 acetylase RimI-like enzyme
VVAVETSGQSTPQWRVRPINQPDRPRWQELFAGYGAFYRITQTQEPVGRVWGWLIDPDHPLEGLVVEGRDGAVVGLAHVREFARPSSATVGGYLDDLFIDPALRGSGAADALLTALAGLAGQRG